MSKFSTLIEDTKKALKQGDKASLLVFRGLQAAIKNELIAQKKDAADDEMVVAVLKREIKKRREARELYEKGGRADLVEQETAELELLEQYLPPQLSEEEIQRVIDEIISGLAEGQKNFGHVMKLTMEKLAGQADGSQVAGLVKAKIS